MRREHCSCRCVALVSSAVVICLEYAILIKIRAVFFPLVQLTFHTRYAARNRIHRQNQKSDRLVIQQIVILCILCQPFTIRRADVICIDSYPRSDLLVPVLQRIITGYDRNLCVIALVNNRLRHCLVRHADNNPICLVCNRVIDCLQALFCTHLGIDICEFASGVLDGLLRSLAFIDKPSLVAGLVDAVYIQCCLWDCLPFCGRFRLRRGIYRCDHRCRHDC